MTTTYAFEVSHINWAKVDEQSVDLTALHWRVGATDGVNTVSAYGTQPAEPPVRKTIEEARAITKSQARSWVQNQMGAEEVQAIKDALDARLAEMAAPTSGTFETIDG